MIARIGRKKFNIFAFDLESHNDEESIAKRETSMWLGCLIDENSKMEDESVYFYEMESFLDHLERLCAKPKRKNGKESRAVVNNAIYIFNLSFEWSFILPVLLERGITFKEHIEKGDSYCFNSITTKTCSSVWEVTIKFAADGGILKLRDLAKIYGGRLEDVAKSFDLKTQKGSIDYRMNRLHGHVVTQEEKEYCFKDTRIIVEILEKLKDDKNFWKSVSMASYAITEMIKSAYSRTYKPYAAFRKDYPFLGEFESDFLRKSVEGGLCFAPPRYQFKLLDCKVLHIDAHQMHPTQMVKEYFPYGVGEYGVGKPKNYKKINCCHIKISYTGVKLHSKVKLIGIDSVTSYEITVWDFELPTMYKVYEGLEIDYIDYFAYEKMRLPWRKQVKKNYELRLRAIELLDLYNKLRFKLLNNSSYGKLLERPHMDIFENYIREDGIIDSLIEGKDLSEIDKLDPKNYNAKYTYLPVGSCIPAYSRVMLIETALKFGFENVAYLDTDSIFVPLNKFTQYVWDHDINQKNELGGWGLEDISTTAMFSAPKRYKLKLDDGTSVIKMAGINFKNAVSFDEVNIINSSWKVQRAYRVKGGTIIDFQDKEVGVQEKYKAIYCKNVKDDL